MSTPDANRAPFGWQLAVCTWFGTGYVRPGPGTWGSLAAAGLAYLLLILLPTPVASWTIAAGAGIATIAGLWCCQAAIDHFGLHDPKHVVIDEVAGTWLAIAILPLTTLADPLLAVVVAVALFRVFDIAKPWPAGWCERLPGAWGIMVDDLAAGVLAGALAIALLG